MKCMNSCDEPAELNITWNTSKGLMSANFCGVCASIAWSRYSNTEFGASSTIGPTKSEKEILKIVNNPVSVTY